MRIAVITPVGPGHESCARECQWSVGVAASLGPKNITVEHTIVKDHKGELGRSKARNRGMALNPSADWFFFLDADDQADSNAFRVFMGQADAVFGWIQLIPRVREIKFRQRKIKTWDDVVAPPIQGSLSMGAFFRAEYATEIGFHEKLDKGEDFEFYLQFLSRHTFVKLKDPLVKIITNTPSAGGPRGYEKLDWQLACKPFVEYWRKRGRVPMTKEEREVMVNAVLKKP